MKKYDLIIGFGCSFMEGGGLDNQTIHMRMHGLETPISLNETEEFRYKNNFIAYLAELYNCEYINFAESRCPNDLIFENIYKYFNNNVSDKKILLVGQISLFNRIYAYYEPIEKFVKVSALRWEDHPFNSEPKMKELINQISQKENDEVVYFYEDLCKRHMLLEQHLDYKNLKDDFFVTKQITEKVNSVAQNNQTILNEFKLKARDYFNQLKKHRIKDWLINPKLNQRVNFYNLFFYFFIVTLFFPFYVIGIIGNYGAYIITKKLTRKIVKNKEFYSSIAIALGMIFFLINYLVWFFVIYLFSANIFFPLFICFLFIMTGWFSLHYHPFKAKTFGMWRILKDKNLYNKFVHVLCFFMKSK